MSCVPYTDQANKALSKKDLEIAELLEKSGKMFMEDSVVRFLLTQSPAGGNAGRNNWKAWIQDFVGVSSMGQITKADVQRSIAEISKMKKAVKRISGEDSTGARALFKKLASLPQDQLRMAGLNELHLDTSIVDQTRDMAMTDLSAKIKDIYRRIDQITGLKSEVAAKEIAKFEVEEAKAQAVHAKLQDMKRKGENVDKKIRDVQRELKRIREEKDKVFSGEGKSGKAAKLLRDFGLYLNGDMSKKEFVDKWRGGNRDQIDLLISSAESFMHGEKIVEKTKEGEELVKVVGGYLPMLREAVDAARKNMALQLKHKYGEEKAWEMAERLVDFKEIDKYYPHKNLMSLYWTMENASKVREASLSGEYSEVEKLVASGGRTGHIMERTSDSKNISWNSVNVLAAYGEEVIRYSHANQAALMINRFVDKLSNIDTIRSAMKSGDTQNEYYKYFDNVRRMLISYSSDMLDTKVPNLLDDAMSTLVAYQAMMKLTSPSTSLLNRAEGVLHYMAWNGMRRGLRGFSEQHKHELLGIMAEAHTNFRPEDVFMDSFNSKNVGELHRWLADYDIADIKLLTSEKAQLGVKATKGAVSKIASLGMRAMGWQKAENANRKESFMLGAAEALQYIKTVWEPRFNEGRVPKYMYERYGINPSSSKAAQWTEFKKKYVIRQGYRAMFQTQFQYNLSQRNMLDKNSVTKPFHMFQHYPRSLASAIGWAAYDVKTLSDVAGLRGIFSKTSGESINGGYFMNKNSQYLLSVGAIHGMRQAIRMFGGIILGQLATHPLQEIIEDLIGYFKDDDEDSRHDRFWGKGIANEITGPLYSDVMDAISLGALKLGIESGEMPMYLEEMSRLTFGFRPDESLLTEEGRRNYSSLYDVVRETFLWDSAAIYPKSIRMMHAIQSGESSQILLEGLRSAGIRQDYKKKKKDDKAVKA